MDSYFYPYTKINSRHNKNVATKYLTIKIIDLHNKKTHPTILHTIMQ